MIKHHVKRGKKKAGEVARKTARQIGEELVEIPKQTVREALGTKKTQESSAIVEAMQQKTEEEGLRGSQSTDEPVKKLDYLEKELEELKKKRELEEEQKKLSEQQEIIGKEEKPKPLLEPPKKKKMGLPVFGKKKTKGTGEMLKSKK